VCWAEGTAYARLRGQVKGQGIGEGWADEREQSAVKGVECISQGRVGAEVRNMADRG
jgi:hypothetical protein